MTDTPINGALKSALVDAADAHVASILADANRVKAAINADLPGVVTTAVSIEALVKAEVAKLKTDVGAVWKPWMTGAVIGVCSIGAVVAVRLVHLF